MTKLFLAQIFLELYRQFGVTKPRALPGVHIRGAELIRQIAGVVSAPIRLSHLQRTPDRQSGTGDWTGHGRWNTQGELEGRGTVVRKKCTRESTSRESRDRQQHIVRAIATQTRDVRATDRPNQRSAVEEIDDIAPRVGINRSHNIFSILWGPLNVTKT